MGFVDEFDHPKPNVVDELLAEKLAAVKALTLQKKHNPTVSNKLHHACST